MALSILEVCFSVVSSTKAARRLPVSYTHLDVYKRQSVSYVVRTEDFDCGIMISASHNPFYDNGIKLLNGNGQKIEAEIEERIEAYLDGEIEELPLAKKEEIGRTIDFASGRNRYIGYLISIPVSYTHL